MFEQFKTLENKTVRHYSHNDMDGYAPQILTRFTSLEGTSYHHCGYGDFEDKLEKGIFLMEDCLTLEDKAILITDIAPKSEELVERLNDLFKLGLTVVLLDHHDTSKWISDKYPEWAWINSKIDTRPTCGTELLHLYLKEKELYPNLTAESTYLDAFVEQVRSYDTWDWAKTNNVAAKELNSLLYTVGVSDFLRIQMKKIALKIHTSETEYGFDEVEQILVDVENRKETKYIESRANSLMVRAWTVEDKTYSVGVVFGDQYHSTLGNDLSTQFSHLDFIAILDLNKSKGSLRTIHDHVHVGEIAKAMNGGGGHQKAAGFEFSRGRGLGSIEHSLNVHTFAIQTA